MLNRLGNATLPICCFLGKQEKHISIVGFSLQNWIKTVQREGSSPPSTPVLLYDKNMTDKLTSRLQKFDIISVIPYNKGWLRKAFFKGQRS